MTKAMLALFPGCPSDEAGAIAAHTAMRGSRRVGRSAAGRELAVAAAVRHRHTDYDELLASGMDRVLARGQVANRVEAILAGWRSRL